MNRNFMKYWKCNSYFLLTYYVLLVPRVYEYLLNDSLLKVRYFTVITPLTTSYIHITVNFKYMELSYLWVNRLQNCLHLASFLVIFFAL